MKRKRGNGNGKKSVPPVVSSNDAVSNVRYSNARDQAGLSDYGGATSGCRLENEMPPGQSNLTDWQADPGSLRYLIRSIIKDLADGTVNKPSRGFASSTNGPVGSASLLHTQRERIQKENSRVIHDPRYKEQELKAALSVVKKIMKLDAAEPFNVPVDPIALRIPDYFDVIETPMDFGKICNNLENELKYMNSEDVYKDVQLIWDNCCKYNKKGNPILELMNKVKTSFMKHWTAAGLSKYQQQPIDGCLNSGTPTQSIMGPATRTEKHTITGITNSSQLQSFPFLYGRQEPESISPQQQSSLQLSATDTEEDELVPFSPHTESSSGHSENSERSLGGPVANDSIGQQLDNVISQVGARQQSSGHSQAHEPQPGSNPSHASLQGHATESPSMKKRRGRGPARCLKLLTRVGRPVVETNSRGVAIGSEAALLKSFLGVMARNGRLAPLTYAHWRKVPEEYKEIMWQEVQKKFEIDPQSKKWVVKTIGERWKSFKTNLKAARYDTHTTDQERLADRDERVLPDQWPLLIQQWNSEKWQRMSAMNKANRAKLKHLHTAGTKSFARVCEEERAKRPDGKEPSQAELFVLTHTRKDCQPINEEAAAVIAQLRECSNEQEENDILNQARGQARNSRPTLADALRMVSEAKTEIHDVKEKMESVVEMCSQMATQMATMMSMITSMQKTSPDKSLHNAADSADAPREVLSNLPVGTSSSRRVLRQTPARKKR